MRNALLSCFLLSLIVLTSCSPFIPLTKDLVEENKLNSDDLKLLQYYSSPTEIKYKGADIKHTSEGIKEGELFKGEKIEEIS